MAAARRRHTEGFGRWYAEKQGELGDPWHRTLIDPALLATVGRLDPGSRILDLGCGNGYLARRFARAGHRVVGVDASRELLGYARTREHQEPLGITYKLRDAAHLTGLPAASFDLVFANMSLMDVKNAASAIREVGRVLRARARFVFSISHPCFDVDNRSTWVTEQLGVGPDRTTTVFRKVTSYRRIHSDRYRWDIGPGQVATTVGYHRPLSWYARELKRAGLVIVNLVEASPGADYVGGRVPKEWLEQIPLHLAVDARREPRPRRGGRSGHPRAVSTAWSPRGSRRRKTR